MHRLIFLWVLVVLGGCRTTGPDLKLLAKADGVQIYHWTRWECACAKTPHERVNCDGAPAVKDCPRLQHAVNALRAAIQNAELVRKGGLKPLAEGVTIPLPEEERDALKDFIDACREAEQ